MQRHGAKVQQHCAAMDAGGESLARADFCLTVAMGESVGEQNQCAG
jgi:hypothetical protein